MDIPIIKKFPIIKDIFSIIIFVICVIIGTIFINTFVFRSFNVIGPSMESTLFTGDRLIVNRLPVTWSNLKGQAYTPKRGDIIVFKNPQFTEGSTDEYIVKRVIAFAGERVILKDGSYSVINGQNPKGFNPDKDNNGEPGSYTSGNVDVIVPDGEIFVSGDHRQGSYSYDSRNGLGTIPLFDIIGPVSLRVFPFTKMRIF